MDSNHSVIPGNIRGGEEFESPYICSVCGKPVRVINNEIIRTCEHINSPVSLKLRAVTSGTGLF